MSEKTKAYEGMFVVSTVGTDFEVSSEPVRNVLGRYQAETLMIKPWDERKLVYEIHGHKRGLYILCFFRADPARIVEIEHDCQLDERFLRVLILRRDKLTPEEIERERTSTVKPPSAPEAEARAAEGERRYGGGGRFPYRRREQAAEAPPSPATEAVEEEQAPEGDQKE
ncbi:MAG: 30S ribosomal protein S6 [Phycisphaerae bacterium]|jgi:small subunit ribosomal protein S6